MCIRDRLSTKDFEALEDALDTLGKDKKKLLVEKEKLDNLREEMKVYKKVSALFCIFSDWRIQNKTQKIIEYGRGLENTYSLLSCQTQR